MWELGSRNQRDMLTSRAGATEPIHSQKNVGEERLNIQPSRIGSLKYIAGIIAVAGMVDQFPDHSVGHLRIDERAVRSDPDDHVGACLACSADEPRQDVMLAAPKPSDALAPR